MSTGHGLTTQILVVGGGLGGVAAALAACRLGYEVVLTEESDWLGGQLTSQGVPPDEHAWIEFTGRTRSYGELRQGIRDYYARNYPLRASSREDPFLNPGQGFVSRLCCEPRVAEAVLRDMLARHRATGRLRVLLDHRPIGASVNQDRVETITFEDLRSGATVEVAAGYVLDATELGDLLPLAGVEHVVGAESRHETHEPHALEVANPLKQQAITWCFALSYYPGEDHTIDRPETYDFWRTYRADFWPGPQLGWLVSEAMTHAPLYRPLFFGSPDDVVAHDLWHFRRILYRHHFEGADFASDITLANWAAIDYWLDPLVGVTAERRRHAMRGAEALSRSMVYWLQTEAPHHRDDGAGYPGLKLRDDVFGTGNGLAKFPYIRKSRRIKAMFTVLEQHIGVEARPDAAGAEPFADSVGISAYRLDLHPTTAPTDYLDLDTWPSQIPLGALVPVRVENLLPAAKNIGTTHLTNGAYRQHPEEWNIGEAAGALAAFCLERRHRPRQVLEDGRVLADFQGALADRLGVPLEWPRFDVLGRRRRFGSPSSIYGGSWVEADGKGGFTVAPRTDAPRDAYHPG